LQAVVEAAPQLTKEQLWDSMSQADRQNTIGRYREFMVQYRCSKEAVLKDMAAYSLFFLRCIFKDPTNVIAAAKQKLPEAMQGILGHTFVYLPNWDLWGKIRLRPCFIQGSPTVFFPLVVHAANQQTSNPSTDGAAVAGLQYLYGMSLSHAGLTMVNLFAAGCNKKGMTTRQYAETIAWKSILPSMELLSNYWVQYISGSDTVLYAYARCFSQTHFLEMSPQQNLLFVYYLCLLLAPQEDENDKKDASSVWNLNYIWTDIPESLAKQARIYAKKIRDHVDAHQLEAYSDLLKGSEPSSRLAKRRTRHAEDESQHHEETEDEPAHYSDEDVFEDYNSDSKERR
jgi:hypothetical protein